MENSSLHSPSDFRIGYNSGVDSTDTCPVVLRSDDGFTIYS